MYEKKPWLAWYEGKPETCEYPHKTLYEMLGSAASAKPKALALRFFGTSINYEKLMLLVDQAALGFAQSGVKAGDSVLICLPNCPQAVISFYALNRLGAVSAMIHPLSASPEILESAQEGQCSYALTLDAFYPRFAPVLEAAAFKKVFVCSVSTYMDPLTALGFYVSKGRKIAPLPKNDKLVLWLDLMKSGKSLKDTEAFKGMADAKALALILFSGGTTGKSKGIMLSSFNCNALAIQTNASGGPVGPGDSMLSILPVFHGFGLAVGIHTMLANGGTCILVPTFTPQSVAQLIKKYRPQFMAGVPTLFEALSSNPVFQSTNLSSFRGIFCGGDTLSPEIKHRFEAVLKQQGSQCSLREGYGLTESVTANMLMPSGHYREFSIGVPYPDMLAKIVRLDTFDEADLLEDGELCIQGPSVMLGYLNRPEETAEVLKTHSDGTLWLHTGDMACMDQDGFFYFKQRLKRVFKSSGISVYPSQVEAVLDSHPSVRMSCVIAIPHATQVSVPRAYVVLKDIAEAGPEKTAELIAWCKKNLLPHSCPREMEFRSELPLTMVGKVAYRQLEEEYARQADQA